MPICTPLVLPAVMASMSSLTTQILKVDGFAKQMPPHNGTHVESYQHGGTIVVITAVVIAVVKGGP